MDSMDGTLSPGEGRGRRPRSDLGGQDASGLLVERSARSVESLRGGGGLASPDPGELLSPPSSPRQRQTTFGATLDFIEVRSSTCAVALLQSYGPATLRRSPLQHQDT